ncbi:uncharacterized protein Dwil_GK19277 [Drosophila willistoni]|uniref:N-acetyltransferase domain-containing protein n=1 Tax=Drosophila willistoni TaxID=7260 RepID=B4MLF3_DROWI|nr:N-alpha-acetyltransferase MAK3 [Drosophila willistoni]EDW72809.1 uncharacterized protein Dwil_GK19277 [Drosophila willistoni]
MNKSLETTNTSGDKKKTQISDSKPSSINVNSFTPTPIKENIEPNEELDDEIEITYTDFHDESQLKIVQSIIDKELSEPYSIYTYRYFVYNWPELCFFACHGERYVGVIVCKLEPHQTSWLLQGYIAMLAVEMPYRKRKIGTSLVQMAIEAMIDRSAAEIILETELSNKPALALYESLGFIREKRLLRYYMNGVDAFRLKLWTRDVTPQDSSEDYV